ncbi:MULTISPECIES: flavodoxin family protein [Microbacterium]|uniref:NAD(P)H-dependent oxidoreductase n=1 Tax=Microbacterium aurugineum TaxID=2851642 RepID=A0ABY4IWH7_9MICO|nr:MULTISPECIES: NAD(P)H-dependent oxidoreductase [Microbacterium]MCE0510520.1 NAD(P)H-dependent oxidoreductase [Microbacterium sp. KKR3/1]MCK8478789.1 NAD(P)H-dependent oxidoreductase [Microbacterium aurugineum]UPL17134.1 NAD(P)H-dependent oxidoreductase [Microbacterium aurugineum]
MKTPLSAVAVSCTLKPSPAASSSDLLATQVLDALAAHGVTGDLVRAVDLTLSPGVEKDMGGDDEWPSIRRRVLDADILVFVTPTWMGQHSSIAQRVLERLDAELGETDARGRPTLFDKVAVAGIVGNEDGAHHIAAILFQSLNDVGYTIPAQGSVYWNGEAMHTTDYKDLEETPEKVASAISTAARNAAHLARALKAQEYPAG